MAFGKLTVDELKAMGLDPEQIKAIKEKMDGIDTTKLSKLDKVDGMETTLNEIKDGLAALTQKVASTPPAKKGEEEPVVKSEEEELDFVLDPAKATATLVGRTMGPVVNAVVSMRADSNYRDFKASNPRGFGKFEKEIKDMWDKQNVAAKGGEKGSELIENIYKIVIANHIDEIQKEPKTFFIESGGGAVNTNKDNSELPAEQQLTPDELKAAKDWGLTPQDYLTEKKKGVVSYA